MHSEAMNTEEKYIPLCEFIHTCGAMQSLCIEASDSQTVYRENLEEDLGHTIYS